MLLVHVILAIMTFLCLGCGSRQSEYRVDVVSEDQDLNLLMSHLVEEYNKDMGRRIFKITNPSDKNASIRFRRNLLDQDGYLGLAKRDGKGNFGLGSPSMDIIFDRETFKNFSKSWQDKSSFEWRYLYQIFCHEVGHGLGLSHSSRKEDVMYPKALDGQSVDFEGYFRAAREAS